jgi:uncharacterized protein (UPF0332 family)
VSLKDWEKFKFITPHTSSAEEIRNLFAIADRDLKDCQIKAVSLDRRFEIAYNAALQVATAALFSSGYRAGRESHHYYIVESLKHTVGIDPKVLNKFRLKRSQANYEFAGVVSDGELAEMIAMAVDLRAQVESWIGTKFPALLKLK